jgi:hypothetical protein
MIPSGSRDALKLAGAPEKEVGSMARLIGALVALEWDENDEPIEIALETESDRYSIAHGHQQEELLAYVGHEVEVEGTVEEIEDDDPVLNVRSFEVLELMTGEDYDEYGEEEFPDPEW